MEQLESNWSIAASPPGIAGSWSPDGSRFAYLDRPNGQTGVYVLNKDGSVDQVSDDTDIQGKPRWSLDGRRLMFSANAPNLHIA